MSRPTTIKIHTASATTILLAGKADAVANWIAAELIELAVAAKRKLAAQKAAATRAVNASDRAEPTLRQNRERHAAARTGWLLPTRRGKKKATLIGMSAASLRS